MKRLALRIGLLASVVAAIAIPIVGVCFAVKVGHNARYNVYMWPILLGTIILCGVHLGLIAIFHEACRRMSASVSST